MKLYWNKNTINYKKQSKKAEIDIKNLEEKNKTLESNLAKIIKDNEVRQTDINSLKAEIKDLNQNLNRPKKKNWFSNKNLSLLVSIFVLIAMCYQAYLVTKQSDIFIEQTRIFDNQTDIIKHQDSLFGIQIGKSQEQNDLIKNQNKLFGKQNEITSLQKDASIEQNSLIKNQNALVEVQNQKIDLQSNLLEADRRSSLVLLFNSLIEKIDQELSLQIGKENKTLQKFTIDRVISLSISLKPYYYLSNGANIQNYLSPERGQLLLFLLSANLDRQTYDTIFEKGNFQYSDMENTFLQDFELHEINLEHSSFAGATLDNIKFIKCNLSNTIFKKVNSDNCIYIGSTIINSNFSESEQVRSKFFSCKLYNIDFSHSSMVNSYFKTEYYNVNQQLTLEQFFKHQLILLASNKTWKDPMFTGTNDCFLTDKNKNNHMSFDEIGDDDNEYYKIYKKLDFSHTDLSETEFNDILFENSDFRNSSMFLISCFKVAFYKCKMSEIKTNLFTLQYIFNKEELYPADNKEFTVIDYVDGSPFNLNLQYQKSAFKTIMENIQISSYTRVPTVLDFESYTYSNDLKQYYETVIVDFNWL
ncbi:pentapeptide repeat-containing protein [uncultured Winogradskyella sp.]|uniref:pentapeptide repeat-containing protein n=1 Tax=uncultured Winogradskyella sp. TaxID=395353 RepID=UPI002637E0B0|nr:pentapeptide repeat-containing protein [uncultured Winogradskyella sp.]